MASNTCPKCGAEIDEPKINRTPYRCRSVKWADDEFDQSDFCRARCELAAAKKDLDTLRTRHQRLVEAARLVVDQYNNGDRAYGVDEFELRIEMLEKALESEANNG
jgi:hypothetical protein